MTFLQGKLRQAIEGVLDADEFNAQLDIEKQDATHIEAHRRVVLHAMGKTLGEPDAQ